MANRKKKSRLASSEPVRPDTPPRWTRGRVLWVSIAILATVGSIIFGVVAMQEADFHKAREAFENKSYRIAKIELEHFLKAHPKHSQAQVLYARTLIELYEQPEVALRIFDEYRAATPEELHAWARANFMLERWSAGVPLVAQVVKDQPENLEALHEWIAALLRMRQYEKALEPAQQFLEKTEEPAKAHVFLGAIAHAMQDAKKAEEHFGKVLEYEPAAENLQLPAHEFLSNYALVLLSNGKAAKARDQAERSIGFERTAGAFYVLGEAYQQLGETQTARDAYRECVLIDLEHVQARVQLAQMELEENEPEDALKWLGRVIKNEDSLSADVAYLVERCYRRLDDQEKIKEWSSRTRSLRSREDRVSKLQNIVVSAPWRFEARLFRAWQFAQEGNWIEAQTLLATLSGREDRYDSDFGAKLVHAVSEQNQKLLPTEFEFQFREDVAPEEPIKEGSNTGENLKEGAVEPPKAKEEKSGEESK